MLAISTQIKSHITRFLENKNKIEKMKKSDSDTFLNYNSLKMYNSQNKDVSFKLFKFIFLTRKKNALFQSRVYK